MRSVLILTLLLFLPAAGSAQTCTDDTQCSGDDACISGLCVSPVEDLEAYAAAAGVRTSSYLKIFQLPALFEPEGEECCFDLDGDGTIDDAFGSLQAAAAGISDVDLQAAIDEGIQTLGFLQVFDWTELPEGLVDGTARFSIFGAFPEEGVTYEDLAAGDGSVILDHATFGPYGAMDQVNDGELVSADFSGTGNSFTFVVPASGAAFVYSLREPRVEIPLEENARGGCSGLCTMDELRPGDTPPVVGGGKLGGLLLADEYLAGWDAFYRTCDCAVEDPGQPVLFWSEGKSSYEASCNNENILNEDTCDEGDTCGSLSNFCTTIAVIPATLDADWNDNEIEDSWTAGFRFGLSGTQINGVTLDPTIFADGFDGGDAANWSGP